MRAWVFPALILLLAPSLGSHSLSATAQTGTTVNANAATIADFTKRVNDYVALHRKLEDTLPHLPKQTTPQEVDGHERALAKLIQAQRTSAKQGDLFTPAMARLVRSLLRPVFQGRGSAQIKKEILDNEYKGDAPVTINGRYPDQVPVSTMPPQVLKALPKLPEELEYRFIQRTLILLDTHAHTIADFMENSFQ